MIMTATTMTAPELAAAIGAPAKIFRSYLRSADSGVEAVGKGKRYALPGTKTAIAKHAKQFAAWQAKQDAARTAREAVLTAAAPPADTAPLDEDALIADDADEITPTDEMIGEVDEVDDEEIEIIESDAALATI